MSRLRLHAEHHLVDRIGWLRAAVLGANDGIVSTASLLAGTCTPFALSAFPTSFGVLICALVWCIAATGALLKLAFPRQLERLLLALSSSPGGMDGIRYE